MARLLCLSLLALSLGCRGVSEKPSLSKADQPVAWICDSMDKVLESDLPPEKRIATIEIETSRNEYESAQIAVRSPSPLKNVSVSFSGSLPAKLSYNFVGYVKVNRPLGAEPADQVGKAPCRLPDPLLPEPRRDVPAETTQPIWITVFTPKDATPGAYRGEVSITADGFNASFPLQLTVWPITIPEERHLIFTNWMFPDRFAKLFGVPVYSDEFYQKLEPYLDAMSAHRQNATWAPWTKTKVTKKDGKYEFDFKEFDRFIEVLEAHKLADVVELQHMGGRTNGKMGFSGISVTEDGTTKHDTSEETRGAVLSALQEHLRAKGWLKKSVLHLNDEAHPSDHEEYRAMAACAKKYAPELRICDAVLSPYEFDVIDVPVPVLHLMHRWEGQIPKNKEIWFYTCVVPQGAYPNRLIQNRLIDTRILHWINRRYNVPGYLHWAVNYWNDKPWEDMESDPSYHGSLPAGDMWIMYPGPASSIRWEAMRDGIEDYELLWLLDQASEKAKSAFGKAAEDLNPRSWGDTFSALAVTDPINRVKDPAILRSLRRRVAQMIIDLQSEPKLLVEATPGPETRIWSSHNLIAVRGVTQPGASVKVNGSSVKPTEDGRFWASTTVRNTSPNVQIVVEKDGKQATRTFCYWVSKGTGHTPDLPFGAEAPVTDRDRMTWLYFEGVGQLDHKEYAKAADTLMRASSGLPADDPLRGSAAYNAACCLALIEKVDEAFAWLEKASEGGWNNRKRAENDSDLDILRKKDPARWQHILELFDKKSPSK